MKLKFKNNFIGYFKFYYSVLGGKVFINLILCVFVSFLDGIGLAMFMPLLEAVGGKGEAAAAGNNNLGLLTFITDIIDNLGLGLTINTILSALVLVFICKGILKYLQLKYQVNLRLLFMKRIRYKLVEDLQGLSYQGFLKFDAGKIQNTLISEVQRLFQTMNFYFSAAQAVVMLTTYLALAFLANYQFAILVAVGAGLTNFFYRRIYFATKKVSRQLSTQGHDFNGFLIQAIHNFKYLKATNYFKKFELKLKNVIDHTEALNQRMGNLNAITTSMKEPMIILVVTLVIYLQISLMGANLASILLSLLLFYRALGFLMTVQNHWQNFLHNVGALYTVTEFTHEIESSQESQLGIRFETLKKGIFLKDIDFSYGDNKIIDKVNIELPKNNTIAFIGESGSGKTTLANIISALVQTQGGKMLIDGLPIDQYELSSYRNKIGYISQEPVIFNDNIFNNVTFWAEPTEENLKHFWEVIRYAALTDYIEGLPEKELTKLGDNGIMISGGQKQRISIARELFKKAEILILDEATSALDSETEQLIQQNIDLLHGSYTMVIIAHRLSTIRNVDTIYLLEKGKVRASGNFDAMLKNSERFQRMVKLQEF